VLLSGLFNRRDGRCPAAYPYPMAPSGPSPVLALEVTTSAPTDTRRTRTADSRHGDENGPVPQRKPARNSIDPRHDIQDMASPGLALRNCAPVKFLVTEQAGSLPFGELPDTRSAAKQSSRKPRKGPFDRLGLTSGQMVEKRLLSEARPCCPFYRGEHGDHAGPVCLRGCNAGPPVFPMLACTTLQWQQMTGRAPANFMGWGEV